VNEVIKVNYKKKGWGAKLFAFKETTGINDEWTAGVV